MEKNTEIDFKELERLAKFGGNDYRAIKPQAIPP